MLVERETKKEEALPPSVRFVSGKGRFVDDLYFDNMLYLKVVRSPYARARILKVEGEITGKELNASMSSVGEGATGRKAQVNYPVLANDYVNYVGQPVAAVLAEDAYSAEDKAEEVQVDYEPLKPIVDPFKALKDEPIHPNTSSNIMVETKLGKDFEIKSDLILEERLGCDRIVPNPLEPRGIVAHYDGSRLNIYGSTQSVYSWKEGICQSLKLSAEQVRVIQMDTGGAFGSKGGIYPEYIIAAYASIKTKRPVKWIETRLEHLQATAHGRGAYADMKIYAKKNGRIVGLKAEVLVDAGAYPVGVAPWAPGWIGYQISGPYAIENIFVKARAVYTNKVPLGPYRGAGRPEAAFFMERMIDILSDELQKDPLEVRMVNAAEGKWTSPLGLEVNEAREFLKRAAVSLRYRSLSGKKGVGLSFFVLIPNLEPGESARLKVGNGMVRVWLGGSSHGQGHDEFARKIVSEELNVPPEKIYFENSDTEQISRGIGSWGSRSAILAGAAIVEACRRIKEKARKKLGPRYRAEDLMSLDLDETVFFKAGGQLNSLGLNVVVAEKDGLGFAKIKEIMAYYDAGRILNKAMAVDQVIGGSMQGLGQVLTEKAAYDEEGQLVVGSITEAGVLKINATPEFHVEFDRARSQFPHGAKGLGESPTIGVPPAAVRAIETLTGKRYRKTPLSQEEILIEGGD
jgi:carbon-monoxide dehydrogenase large subunit